MTNLFRSRPHWYMLVFHYGLGVVVLWQLLDDLINGQWKIYSGDFYPWRQYVRLLPQAGVNFYWGLVVAELVLLALYFMRVRLRWTAALLAAVLFVDGLGSFLNHRLLMSLQLFMVSLCPLSPTAHRSGFRGKQVYWSLDLIRWQMFLVYFTTAMHKTNWQFVSGATLHNLFFMVREHGMCHYPDWLYTLLQNPDLCLGLACGALFAEYALAFGLNARRTVGWCLAFAVGMHIGFSLLMPFIWVFTAQILFTLVVFLPDRVQDGDYRLLHAGDSVGVLRFVKLVWPGYVLVVSDEVARGWCLEMPTGDRLTGYRAWVELMSLSPLTFLAAEVLRIAPFLWLGNRWDRWRADRSVTLVYGQQAL